MNQLMLEVEEMLGGEEEAAFEQVLREDTDSNNIQPFIQEVMSTIGKLKARCEKNVVRERKMFYPSML